MKREGEEDQKATWKKQVETLIKEISFGEEDVFGQRKW